MHKRRLGMLAVGLLGTMLLFAGRDVTGCPFCDAPTTTFSEQLDSAHAALLVRWKSATREATSDFVEGATIYEILAAHGKGRSEFIPGNTLTVNRYIAGRTEDECLLFANRQENGEITWGLPLPVSPECWKYLQAAPTKGLPIEERIPFFLKYLEHADPDIAMDAYCEFAGISYANLKDLAPRLPREKIIGWLNDPLAIPTRKGLFGLMLGLCGTPEDAVALSQLIRQQPEDARMGIDGAMAGYLLLTGNDGLKQLIDWKLNDPATPDHEVFSLLKALEFVWIDARDEFDSELLRTSLRQLLPRSQLTGLVILDLARWEDWSVMDHLVAGYGQEPYADRTVKQYIVRYLLAATKVTSTTDAPPPHAEKARRHLDQLRNRDPATVKYVERYPFD